MLALRHALEYVLLRAALGTILLLPYGAAYSLSRLLARAWWVVDVRRRRVATSNVLRSGLRTDRGAARRLARASFEHMGLLVTEAVRSTHLLDDPTGPGSVELRIAPDVLAVLEDPTRGLIMASGHFGNWEVAAHVLARYKPVAGITRPMNNPRVEALVQRIKPRERFHPIPKYDANPKRFLQVLSSGEILALLTDQHCHTRAVSIPLFGHPVASHTTAAMLHLVARAPLCFAVCRRIGPGRFRLETSPLIEHAPTGDKKADVRHLLETLNRHLEETVRSAPE